LPDGIDRHDKPVWELLGAGRFDAPEQSPGVYPFVGYVADQGFQNCCVAEAVSQAIYCRQRAEGRKGIRPSQPFLYSIARSMDGLERVDLGCRPRACYRAVSAVGYCSEEVWPRGMRIDEPPPLDVYRQAVDQSSIEYYRIASAGEIRCREIRAALSRQHPVTLALRVDASYQQGGLLGYWPGPREDDLVIGHYVCATHYDAKGLWHVGSYGVDWGHKGFCRVPWSIIADPRFCSDIWAIRYAPMPLAA
jgi:hypothetical protein